MLRREGAPGSRRRRGRPRAARARRSWPASARSAARRSAGPGSAPRWRPRPPAAQAREWRAAGTGRALAPAAALTAYTSRKTPQDSLRHTAALFAAPAAPAARRAPRTGPTRAPHRVGRRQQQDERQVGQQREAPVQRRLPAGRQQRQQVRKQRLDWLRVRALRALPGAHPFPPIAYTEVTLLCTRRAYPGAPSSSECSGT